jgi:hypothetical protein
LFDLAADLCESISKISAMFCEQLGRHIGRLFRLSDLADGTAPETNALAPRIARDAPGDPIMAFD